MKRGFFENIVGKYVFAPNTPETLQFIKDDLYNECIKYSKKFGFDPSLIVFDIKIKTGKLEDLIININSQNQTTIDFMNKVQLMDKLQNII